MKGPAPLVLDLGGETVSAESDGGGCFLHWGPFDADWFQLGLTDAIALRDWLTAHIAACEPAPVAARAPARAPAPAPAPDVQHPRCRMPQVWVITDPQTGELMTLPPAPAPAPAPVLPRDLLCEMPTPSPTPSPTPPPLPWYGPGPLPAGVKVEPPAPPAEPAAQPPEAP